VWAWLRSLLTLPSPPPPHPELIPVAPADVASRLTADWLLEWNGCLLPYGPGYRGSLLLWDSGTAPAATIESPVSRINPVPLRPVPLPEKTEHLLRSILHEAFPERLLNRPPFCNDGLPFEIVVYRRASYLGVRASCNLAEAMSEVREGDPPPPWCLADYAEATVAGQPLAPLFRVGFLLASLSIEPLDPA
jgi:hypothetical protein